MSDCRKINRCLPLVQELIQTISKAETEPSCVWYLVLHITCRGYHEWLSYFHKEPKNTDTNHILYKNLHLSYRTMSRLLIYIGKSWFFSRLINKNWDFLTPPSLCIPVQIMSARQMMKWSSQHPSKWKILLTAYENDLECIFHSTINL